MDGIFLINKEIGWTSFDVCAKMRKKFNTKKVGHTGTLDPFAEGLMIVALGRATKIIPFLEDLDKEYVAKLKLFVTTDTLDKTGKIIKEDQKFEISKEQVLEALDKFKGDISQVPPMYSALKVQGVPLYEMARNGIEIERKPRNIHIYSLDLLNFDGEYIDFSSRVSKGTYIRTLGSDIALSLNTVGHLTDLKRTKVGKFSIENSKKVEDITEVDAISISSMLPHFDNVIVDEETEKKIRNGVRLSLEGSHYIFLKNKNNDPLAIYEQREDGFYYTKRGLFE